MGGGGGNTIIIIPNKPLVVYTHLIRLTNI